MTESSLLAKRRSAAYAAIWAAILVDIGATITAIGFGWYLSTLEPSAIVGEIESVPIEIADGLMSLLQVIALGVAGVLFIRWFRLVYDNAGRINESPAAYSRTWVLWGFLVPFLNLVRPAQVMRDVWARTETAWRSNPQRVVAMTMPENPIKLWWTWFVATCVIGNVGGRAYWRAETAEETSLANGILVVANLVDIIAGWYALGVIQNVSELQKPLLGATPAGPAA